jgi:hypothetical protein
MGVSRVVFVVSALALALAGSAGIHTSLFYFGFYLAFEFANWL